MNRAKIIEMKRNFCQDCPEEPEKCGYNPAECMEEARLYFRLYDRTFNNLRKGS